jgi:hypothetical protein
VIRKRLRAAAALTSSGTPGETARPLPNGRVPGEEAGYRRKSISNKGCVETRKPERAARSSCSVSPSRAIVRPVRPTRRHRGFSPDLDPLTAGPPGPWRPAGCRSSGAQRRRCSQRERNPRQSGARACPRAPPAPRPTRSVHPWCRWELRASPSTCISPKPDQSTARHGASRRARCPGDRRSSPSP